MHFWFSKTAIDGRSSHPVFTCGACAGAFVHPVPSEQELHAFYTDGSYAEPERLVKRSAAENLQLALAQERAFPNSVLDAERLAKAAKALATGSTFLDVGAGLGFFSRAACAQGFEVAAIEVNEESRGVFREMNGFDAAPGMLDHDFAVQHEGRYAVVLLSQVLEHIRDVNSTVPDLRRMLAQGGICVVAVPHFGSLVSRLQGRNDMFITPPEHLNYFSREGLMRLFARHGFECCRVDTISRFDQGRLQRNLRLPWLGTIAGIGLRSILGAADKCNRGMFLNAYFRKA
jgi:SAM-dependent methyltransferase